MSRPSPEEIQATLERVHYLYDERNKLAHLYNNLDLNQLRTVNAIIPYLSKQDLARILDFAETLASFSGFTQSSPGERSG